MDERFLNILPKELVSGLRRLPKEEWDKLQEIRLRCSQPAAYLAGCREHLIPYGMNGFPVDANCLQSVVNRATGYCTYQAASQIRSGFYTLPGGHRLGLCGTGILEGDGVRSLRAFSSLNLRIARQLKGCSDSVMAFIRNNPGSTLIAGPPGCGKTTLLRELICDRSDSCQERVGVVDERMELAACSGGYPGFYIGRMTDVLSGVPKHEGIYMLLRTMNPDWIAVDEITQDRDVDALVRSSFCGVRILASAHVFCKNDLYTRPLYARMCREGLFENLILMDKHHGVKMERMNANDKAHRGGTDYHILSIGGHSPGNGRASGGAEPETNPSGFGADVCRNPKQDDRNHAVV